MIPTMRHIPVPLLLWCLILVLEPARGTTPLLTGEEEAPRVSNSFAKAIRGFDDYKVILEPDQNEPEWWAGAPSVVRDRDGIFWLAARMRTADSPRGLRGYEIRILRSENGIDFREVHRIPREAVPIDGFERPALTIDPHTGQFKLYACGPWEGKAWSIIKFDDADSPVEFDPASARAVISPASPNYEREITVTHYKDPVIFYSSATGKFHCYLIGYLRRNEWIFHFTSTDGETWEAVGNRKTPVMELTGWHNFFVRPASIVPIGPGYLFIYEGSSTTWYDPVYNIATGLGFSFDLEGVIDLTPKAPLAVSTTPGEFHTFRYSDWLWVDGELWVYAEVARPNNSNEIRLYRLTLD